MQPPAFLIRFGPRLRLPRRTVRMRLTALYGVLFLLSSAGLLAIINFANGSAGVTRNVPRRAAAQAAQVHAAYSHQLLIVSLVGLAIMVLVSAVLGWLAAGRILRPLRAMTTATRQMSEDDLHRRLAMPGPGDELKDLADTIDGLLARLQAAFDAQRNFVANASHELRTPLTVERAMLEVALADPAATAENLRRTCEDVLAAGRQQERLIEDHHHARPRRRPPAAAAGRQPDRQRYPPQHPPWPDRHPGHHQRRPPHAHSHQHRPRHPRRPGHPAAPAVPAPIRGPARRRRRPRLGPVHRRGHHQGPPRHPHRQSRPARGPRHRHQISRGRRRTHPTQGWSAHRSLTTATRPALDGLPALPQASSSQRRFAASA